MIETGEKTPSLANKTLDELATEIALLPEGSEQIGLYHDEIVRRQEQADLDSATAQLASERKKYPIVTIFILAIGFLAMVASMMLQK